jgi:hypothetical protein
LYPVAHRSEIQKPYLDQRVTLFSNRKLRLAGGFAAGASFLT